MGTADTNSQFYFYRTNYCRATISYLVRSSKRSTNSVANAKVRTLMGNDEKQGRLQEGTVPPKPPKPLERGTMPPTLAQKTEITPERKGTVPPTPARQTPKTVPPQPAKPKNPPKPKKP